VSDPISDAQDTLRGEILRVGVDDFVSMAAVHGIIDEDGLADSAVELQRLVVETVRSLLEDGLIEVGVISPRSPGFKAWPGALDEVMMRFTDSFVAHYDDRYEWAYKIWLNLTPEGREASTAFVDES
jgi:hypothetical protein